MCACDNSTYHVHNAWICSSAEQSFYGLGVSQFCCDVQCSIPILSSQSNEQVESSTISKIVMVTSLTFLAQIRQVYIVSYVTTYFSLLTAQTKLIT